MSKPHVHAPIRSQRRELPFLHCVNGEACTPGAHGNVTVIDTCRCGARRRANTNQAFYESSGWQTDGR